MSFLTTLLGSEHVERFIPLAVPSKSGTTVQRTPAAAAAAGRAEGRTDPATTRASETSGTGKVARTPAPVQPPAPSRVIPAAARRKAATRVIPAASASRAQREPGRQASIACRRGRVGRTRRHRRQSADTAATTRSGAARNTAPAHVRPKTRGQIRKRTRAQRVSATASSTRSSPTPCACSTGAASGLSLPG